MEHLVSLCFGQVLRTLRLEAGMTQEKLGEEAQLQRNYISSLELGQKQPSLLTVFKIAEGLKIQPDRFVGKVHQQIREHQLSTDH